MLPSRVCGRIWNGPLYQDFRRNLLSDTPPKPLRELRDFAGPSSRWKNGPRATVIIPTLNERDAIAAVIREIPREVAAEIIVADSGSKDGTQQVARGSGRHGAGSRSAWIRPGLRPRG